LVVTTPCSIEPVPALYNLPNFIEATEKLYRYSHFDNEPANTTDYELYIPLEIPL